MVSHTLSWKTTQRY